jgi:predicted DNA-binding transcriptional regulator YafY
MDNYPLIKRFSIIVDTITQRPPTLKELLNRLHKQGFEISKRTLQRDIEYLKIDFGLDIQYKASTHTYHLDKDKSEHLELQQLLLKYGSQLKILKPKGLAEHFTTEAKNIATLYEEFF